MFFVNISSYFTFDHGGFSITWTFARLGLREIDTTNQNTRCFVQFFHRKYCFGTMITSSVVRSKKCYFNFRMIFFQSNKDVLEDADNSRSVLNTIIERMTKGSILKNLLRYFGGFLRWLQSDHMSQMPRKTT